MPTARLSPEATSDLEAIWDYTKERWGHAQAVRYIRDLDSTFAGIAEGRVVSRSAEDVRPGYRQAHCGSHIIYFLTHGDDIDVIRVLHQSMDVDRHL